MIAKKSLGQNFLYDKNIVRKIVASSEVKSGDVVLEIGPGHGILTEALLEVGARVVAVEMDEDLIGPFKEKFGGQKSELTEVSRRSTFAELRRTQSAANLGRLVLFQGDILSEKIWEEIRRSIGRQKYSVVANIPYNITSPILETLFRAKPRPERLTLMIQREVADRMLATPPKTSVLSIACQLYAEGKKVMRVSRGSFRPAPKVDSTVVRLDLRQKWLGDLDPEDVLKIVKIGFAARRKQLQGNLAKACVCSAEKTKEILKKLDLNEKSRAENLTVEEWVEFYRLVGPHPGPLS